jgi:hypothetical protein
MLKTLRYQYLSILWAIFVVIICEIPASDISPEVKMMGTTQHYLKKLGG